MTLTYSLSQDDYLNHQLFVASLSERVKMQRRRSRIMWSIGFLSLTWLFYLNDNHVLAYYFLAASIFYIFFFQYYSRWYYKRHYKKFVNETYKNRFGKISNVIIDEEHIEDFDESGETKIPISQLENIYETTDYFFLKLKSGGHLIMPKKQIPNLDLVKDELNAIADRQKLRVIEMKNWKWT
jgi:hypothetical protein